LGIVIKNQNRRVHAYLSTSLVFALCLVVSGLGWAQAKHKIHFVNLPEITAYSQQYRLEAGDVPGHYVRIFEIQRLYPNNPPKFEGVGNGRPLSAPLGNPLASVPGRA
jgi:hypothetical protein